MAQRHELVTPKLFDRSGNRDGGHWAMVFIEYVSCDAAKTVRILLIVDRILRSVRLFDIVEEQFALDQGIPRHTSKTPIAQNGMGFDRRQSREDGLADSGAMHGD